MRTERTLATTLLLLVVLLAPQVGAAGADDTPLASAPAPVAFSPEASAARPSSGPEYQVTGQTAGANGRSPLLAPAEGRPVDRGNAAGTSTLPADIPGDWWTAVQEDIRRSEYHISRQVLEADGGSPLPPDVTAAYQAPNRAQGLRTYFTPAGIRLVPRVEEEPSWELGLSLEGYGEAQELLVEGSRVAYQRGPGNQHLSEWYLNEEEGLEMGLRIEGPRTKDERSLVLRLSSSTLTPRLTPDGTALELLDPAGTVVLRYGPFQAVDAAGRPVPVQLALDSSRLLVSLSPCPLVSLSPCLPVSLSPCPLVSLSPCLPVSLSPCPLVPLSPCLPVSLSPCPLVSLSPCPLVSLSPSLPLTLTARLTAAPGHTESSGGLLPPSGWIAESNQESAHFGCAVAAAGDVNGDGYGDVIVGARYYDNGQTDEGRAYVYLGSISGLGTSAHWIEESDQGYAQFGWAVGTAGDVNGDGYGDVIVGANGYDHDSTWDVGAAFVYCGSADGLPSAPTWAAESDQGGAQFGFAVGSAGDVNGDGYGDVIVGAVSYDNGESNEGRAYVYHGSADGLPSSPTWITEGNQAEALFGGAVGTAGDVNGDGYSDVIVGASAYDNGQTDEGAAFVWYGSAGGFGPNGTPANADWTAESNQAGATFGFTAATAGDVDGDGFADVIVGARLYDSGENDEGRAFVYYGSASGLSPDPGWTAEGDQVGAWFGWALDSAGDVDGDGYGDVVIGAPSYDNGQGDAGRAFVYHGSAGGLSPIPTWTAESDQGGAQFGFAVGTAGDVNGDGYGDVIVGALYYDSGQADEGRAYVYLGSTTALVPDLGWTAESDQGGAQFGLAVDSAGDVDGDGYGDVIIGAPYYDNGQGDAGRIFVYCGSTGGLLSAPTWTAESDQAGASFGLAVGTAGDVNGDGYGDIMVGAETYDSGYADNGRAYVYHGSAGGLPSAPDWSADGDRDGARLGRALRTAGDVNADGYDDVIVGAPYYNNGQANEGRAYVYHGSPDGLMSAPAWSVESDLSEARFGYSVGTAGDVNGDSYADVIVGAPCVASSEVDEGRVYLYHGSADGLPSAPAWTAEGNQVGAHFGYRVGTAGDVNGDDYADVVVGSFYHDTGEVDEGLAFVYHGSSGGLPPSPSWAAQGDQAGAQAGMVGTAGDVNGDGYDDVIVGAPYYNNDLIDEGRAYVYHGGPAGLSRAPDWKAEGDQIAVHFGYAVATAGDVNGDGYDDVIVGAYGYDNGNQPNAGRAYVYQGSAGGLPSALAWTVDSDQASAYFGFAVGSAGDVNGDGYSDIIVGAYGYDNGETDEGRAYVYLGSPGGFSPTPTWTAESDQAGGQLGAAVGSAGDVNGDGYSDVVVGADRYDNGETDEGRAYVYLGWTTGISTAPPWTAESDQGSAYFGHAAATAGDVNGDGFDDVIVGALGYDSGTYDWGRAYVYLGSASGLDPTAHWIKLGDAASDQFGFAVGTAGDVNGDGYADVIVGAFGCDSGTYDWGRAYVYLGSASGLDPTASWIELGEAANDQFGFAVGTAGDVNGDGYSDVIVAAHGHDNGQIDEGRAYVYLGSPGGLSPDPDWTAESDQASAHLGLSVGSAGDVNGDGYADVVVGAPYYDGGQADEGAALVYHGSAQGLSTAPAWTMVGRQYNGRAGLGVGTAGDVNGDGYADLIVGAYLYDNGEVNEGRASVFHGSPGGLARAAAWTAAGDQASAQLGLSVGSAGDVNGDGYADVIVGAPYYDAGDADEGRAYVYYGGAAGVSPTPQWQAEGEQPQANLGWAVGTAGDVDGDGYADVIVGAPGFDDPLDPQADEGGVFVWHGSPLGLGSYGTPGNAKWLATGDQVNAYLGHSAGTAGDVNGDGYADVIAGAYGYDNGQDGEGRAYAYLGSADGLATTPAWTAEGDQVNAQFGWAVGTAGDVDGDGYSDVVVGAPRFDDSQADEGRAYVYRGSPGGLLSAPAWTAGGGQAGAQFGFAVGTAGDVNGDGFAEVVVGAPYHDHGPGRPAVGRAYAYYGSAVGTLPAVGWMAEGDQAEAFLGYAVSSAGDVNGDGYADVVVGAPYYSGGPAGEGRALVYHGTAAGLSATARWIAGGGQANVHLGYAVGAAGDANGDGYADLVVGVPLYSNGQASEGAARLYYGGGGAGLDLSPRQMRSDGSAPIAPLGMSDSPPAVQVRLTGRMPLGREDVKLQWQAAPLSTPFTATTVVSGTSATWTDTLTSGVVITSEVTGLIPGAPYHWRVRLLYPPGNLLGQPAGRWVHIPWNGWTEEDFRTPGECYAPADASFGWVPRLPAAGETITFTGAATGTPPLAFSWDWGDGQGAGGSPVTHSYALSGTYAVVLTVAGPCGSRALVGHTVYVGRLGGWQVYLPLLDRGDLP